MTEEQAKICQAIETCQGDHLSVKEQSRIAAEYGEEIAIGARKLYDDTIGCPVDWSIASVDDGLKVLGRVCEEQYPWLTDRARGQIVHWFVMAWK